MGHVISIGGPNIFIAASWRSGSTHIAKNLSGMLNWRLATTAGRHGEGENSQDVNPLLAITLFPYGFQVFQQHALATEPNLFYLNAYNAKIVVTHRDVFDTLVSLRDTINKYPLIPGLLIPKHFRKWDLHKQEVWLARNATPWLCQFEMGWLESGIPHLDVRYEDFFKDQKTGFEEILEFVDQDAQYRSPVDVNVNVGKAGRGDAFTCRQEVLSVIRSFDLSLEGRMIRE